MSAHSGFLYYFNLLGLDRDAYRVHYSFTENSGLTIPNSAPSFPQLSGLLSVSGNFYSGAGTGYFSNPGQYITIQNATGLPSDFWTHIFVYEKSNSGRSILYDSLQSGEIVSGYTIGINDGNKLFFESFDQTGPFSKTSSVVLGKKNIVAAVRANSLLTFYCFDFNNDEILSDSFSLNGDYVLPAAKGIIGQTLNSPEFLQTGSFQGSLDEYVFLQEGITPSTFRYLVSGLCSDYVISSGEVTYISGIEVTGYLSGVTGVTGITGYLNQVTGSGLDPFGTGEYELYWGSVAQTGYLVSGLGVTAQTGYVVRSITGDNVETLILRTGYTKEFDLDEVSYIRKIDAEDISLVKIYPIYAPKINLEAGYDFVLGKFQMDAIYPETAVEVYLNGIAQLSTGFAVTGNFYQSGVVLSGDYRLDGFYLDGTGFYTEEDVVIFDRISGARERVTVTGAYSGVSEPLLVTGQFIYFNGVLQLSGLDYGTGTTGQFRWITNKYDGETGALIAFPPMFSLQSVTGEFPIVSVPVARRASQLFLNGQRQWLNRDYIENSAFDLIHQSGIFETSFNLLYNDDENFFEDFEVIDYLTVDMTSITVDSILFTVDMTEE